MNKIENKNRYLWIDSLKGLSILGVVLIHSGAMGLGGPISVAASYGSVFVQAFFVVSSFLIWKSLERLGRNFGFQDYMKWLFRKISKLIPAYYLSIFIYLLVTGGNQYWAGDVDPFSIQNIIAHILFLHGLFPKFCNNILGVEWYVGVLALFYLIAPLLYKIIDNLPKALAAFVLSDIACYYICIKATGLIIQDDNSYIYEEYFNNYGFISQLPTLMLGVVICYIMPYVKKDSSKWLKILLSSTIVLLAFCMLRYHAVIPLFKVSTPTLYGIFFGMILFSQSIYAMPIFNNRIFAFLGRQSWEIYLFHFILIIILDKYVKLFTDSVLINWAIKYFLSILIVICVASLVKLILKRLKNIKK